MRWTGALGPRKVHRIDEQYRLFCGASTYLLVVNDFGDDQWCARCERIAQRRRADEDAAYAAARRLLS